MELFSDHGACVFLLLNSLM